jgi:hypothetical protein
MVLNVFFYICCGNKPKNYECLCSNVAAVNFDLSLTISCKPQIASSKLADCVWHGGRPESPQDGRLVHQWRLRQNNETLVTLNLSHGTPCLIFKWHTLRLHQRMLCDTIQSATLRNLQLRVRRYHWNCPTYEKVCVARISLDLCRSFLE